jgi:hypothetical protein
VALIGNTAKLRFEFKDFEGVYCDPESLELKIYDSTRKQVGVTQAIEAKNKVAVGIYECLYIIPDGAGALVYEVSGTVEGNPIIGRGLINRSWY